MSSIRSSDYNQPNSRFASLKPKSRTQSKSTNKAAQMVHSERSLRRSMGHRLSDSSDCCDDDKGRSRLRPRSIMCWESVLVFSVIVLINVASISCTAARQQPEGEYTHFISFSIVIFTTSTSDRGERCFRGRAWTLSRNILED